MTQPDGLFYNRFDAQDLEHAVQYVQHLDYNMPAPSGRKVVQFGPVYDYQSRQLKPKVTDIPPQLLLLASLVNKFMIEQCNLPPQNWNQCIVNRYQPGEGIAAHSDHRDFGPIVACFTFVSGAEMRFRKNCNDFALFTDPNSLYVMSGPARYTYTHQMIQRKSDLVNGVQVERGVRYSVTFRTAPDI